MRRRRRRGGVVVVMEEEEEEEEEGGWGGGGDVAQLSYKSAIQRALLNTAVRAGAGGAGDIGRGGQMHLHASRSSVKWFWVSTASIGCDWEGGRRACGRGRRFPPFEPMLSMSTAPRAHTRSSPRQN